MDETLLQYLQSVEESIKQYEDEALQTKEYLQSMQETEKWLQERCDEDSRN